MSNIAYIFPGQGAQYVGMGEDLYHRYSQAREVFEQASSILDFDLTKLIFQGPPEELTKTDNCQVAIFTVSAACLSVLRQEQPEVNAKYTAGLSLGEYTALVTAGALEFEQALKLVRKRAQYMDEAAQQNPGGMVSLIGLEKDKVGDICAEANVEIANLNCPGQIVISGSLAALERAKELAQTQGAKRIITLKVSGAFHSSLMKGASVKLAEALEGVEIRPPKISVVSNVTAGQEGTAEEIKDNLIRQLVSPTLWEDSVRFISKQGIKNFLEIGPGKVLKGLLRRIDPQLEVNNIEKVQDLEQLKKE